MIQEEKCMTCGTLVSELPETPWTRYIERQVYSQCKPCRQKEIETQIACFQASGDETELMDEIICPYCGNHHEQDSESSAFYNEGEHEFDCGNCHNTFRVETQISFSYTTTKK